MGLLLLTVTAQANMIIDLGITTGQPSDIPLELDRLNTQIKHYNDINSPDLESAVGWLGTKTETPNGGKSITLDLEGFDGYILFKWGNKDHFYYINDLTANNNTFPPMVVYMEKVHIRFPVVSWDCHIIQSLLLCQKLPLLLLVHCFLFLFLLV